MEDGHAWAVCVVIQQAAAPRLFRIPRPRQRSYAPLVYNFTILMMLVLFFVFFCFPLSVWVFIIIFVFNFACNVGYATTAT